jgi:hypothetical protein
MGESSTSIDHKTNPNLAALANPECVNLSENPTARKDATSGFFRFADRASFPLRFPPLTHTKPTQPNYFSRRTSNCNPSAQLQTSKRQLRHFPTRLCLPLANWPIVLFHWLLLNGKECGEGERKAVHAPNNGRGQNGGRRPKQPIAKNGMCASVLALFTSGRQLLRTTRLTTYYHTELFLL